MKKVAEMVEKLVEMLGALTAAHWVVKLAQVMVGWMADSSDRKMVV